MKVLILDDDKALLRALEGMLTSNGYDVDCSDNARDAVQMVAKYDYDFVLVDYKMPENDGIWFMENAKIPRKTKILLSTAYANRNVIKKMFALGASGYLIKPYDQEELLRNLAFYSF
ncbi:MAG: response regulator [Lentisphaerae bacterium]|nr:response regulator [Lentisphaerota bacterium]